MSSNPFYNPDPAKPTPLTGHDDGQPAVLRPAADQPANQPVSSSDAAVSLIRQKLAGLYADEPDAGQELRQAETPDAGHSRHQDYMQQLHASGKPMAQIQTEWHQYYQQLSDSDKHQVWQEFYNHSSQSRQPAPRVQPQYQHRPEPLPVTLPAAITAPAVQPTPNPLYAPADPSSDSQATASPATPQLQPEPTPEPTSKPASEPASPSVPTDTATATTPAEPTIRPDTTDSLRQRIRQSAASPGRGRLKAKHHLQSLAFGLGFGALVLFIVLFSFFNEVVIAPFIQPSRSVSATPIIVSPDGVTATDKDEVIIPKINVQIPLEFSAKTTNEKEFEAALDKGVSHYPTTALPGQKGNTSFFGHSSNNIFNPGQYKFAFVLLSQLVPGDTFYLTYKGTAYAYQVYDKKIVEANQVEILNPVAGKESTAMLVTCDPPGTSLRRLAVWGEQVSPSPTTNSAATPSAAAGGTQTKPANDLPGNGPTLWNRLTNFFTGD